jgi:ABC-type dipeptide/oligopeptide/nickel transport system permease component
MEEDYVRTARAKGIRESLVTIMHIFRNALIPIVTYLGLLAGSLLSGQVFVENVFGRPGLGRFLVDSISARDYPQIRGGILFVAVGYVFVNLIVDLLYGVIDPRITYE